MHEMENIKSSTNVCHIHKWWDQHDNYSLGFSYSAQLLTRLSTTPVAEKWLNTIGRAIK
jgi:hypothetical protein